MSIFFAFWIHYLINIALTKKCPSGIEKTFKDVFLLHNLTIMLNLSTFRVNV